MTEAPEEGTPLTGVDRERQKSPRRGMCAAVLTLESITLGLTSPVLVTIADVPVGTALAIGLGFLVPMMFFLGGLFALLWGSAYGLGRKIERERAAAFAAHDRAQADARADGHSPG